MEKFLFKTLVSMCSVGFFVSALAYDGSRPSEIWNIVKSSPYGELPHYKVSIFKFFAGGRDLISRASRRTLTSHEDILKPFDKLVHANGVCLKGLWRITENNPFGGYFKQGSEAIMLARASVAFSETTVNNFRGFGFAGKLYPTTDFFTTSPLKTANFFAVDSLPGTLLKHYTEAQMTNQPKISIKFGHWRFTPPAISAGTSFVFSDFNAGIRQLYEISELGEENPTMVRTPYWIKIATTADTPPIDEADFRDEILAHIKSLGELKFDIAVASKPESGSEREWQTIGRIVFNDAVASEACDKILHFNHPKYRFDLNY